MERLARWLWPDAPLFVWWEVMRAVQIPVTGGPRHFNPFTNPADERDLLTAVQERWGKVWLLDDDVSEVQGNALRNWYAFMRHLCAPHPTPWISMGGLVAQIQTGDIARAVDAVLRQYPEGSDSC